MKPQDQNSITRRTVIASATFIPLAALTAQPVQAQAAGLSKDERRTLEAFIDRLVPKDESGPGAIECGAADYIDRCFGDYLASEKPIFIQGLAQTNALAMRTQGAALADLSPEKRDAVLMAMEHDAKLGGFFSRVRRLTLEGMFSDPSYGGNKNFAGWDLIRYPGAKLASTPDDQRMKTPPKPYRQKLYKDDGDNHGGH